MRLVYLCVLASVLWSKSVSAAPCLNASLDISRDLWIGESSLPPVSSRDLLTLPGALECGRSAESFEQIPFSQDVFDTITSTGTLNVGWDPDVPSYDMSSSAPSESDFEVGVSDETIAGPVDFIGMLRASRDFSGPMEYPPAGFAGYGVVAFKERVTQVTRPRFAMFCEAYATVLMSTQSLVATGTPRGQQMVTVWPVRDHVSSAAAREGDAPEDACETAVAAYDTLEGQRAVAEANSAGHLAGDGQRLNGLGPFLLAWAPGSAKGPGAAIVLVADLSAIDTPFEARTAFAMWAHDIQRNEELWNQGGWNIGMLRRMIARWADRVGEGVLLVVTG